MPIEKPKTSRLFKVLMTVGVLIVLYPFLKVGYHFVRAYIGGALGA